MIRIYRKDDLEIVGSCVSGMSAEDEIRLNVIPNFGGAITDYEAIWTDKQSFHLEIKDGNVVVIEDIKTTRERFDPEKTVLYEAVANLFEEVEALKEQLGGARE